MFGGGAAWPGCTGRRGPGASPAGEQPGLSSPGSTWIPPAEPDRLGRQRPGAAWHRLAWRRVRPGRLRVVRETVTHEVRR